MVKRVAGGVILLLAVFVSLLAGNGPLEGPTGLAVGLGFGCLFFIVGGAILAKSFLEPRD